MSFKETFIEVQEMELKLEQEQGVKVTGRECPLGEGFWRVVCPDAWRGGPSVELRIKQRHEGKSSPWQTALGSWVSVPGPARRVWRVGQHIRSVG